MMTREDGRCEKLFYSIYHDEFTIAERLDGEYRLSVYRNVVIYVYDYKTIREAKQDGWIYLGAL